MLPSLHNLPTGAKSVGFDDSVSRQQDYVDKKCVQVPWKEIRDLNYKQTKDKNAPHPFTIYFIDVVTDTRLAGPRVDMFNPVASDEVQAAARLHNKKHKNFPYISAYSEWVIEFVDDNPGLRTVDMTSQKDAEGFGFARYCMRPKDGTNVRTRLLNLMIHLEDYVPEEHHGSFKPWLAPLIDYYDIERPKKLARTASSTIEDERAAQRQRTGVALFPSPCL